MEGGPPSFAPDSTCPTLLGNDGQGGPSLSPTGLSPSPVALSSDFAGRSAREDLCNSPGPPQRPPPSSHNPPRATAAAFNTREVWAPPRSLAATRGISFDFFSSRYWDVSLRGVRLRRLLDFGDGCRTFSARRVAPFGNPRIIACSAAPRGLSQLATPFIASGCRGIHRPPLPYLRSRRPIHFSKTGNIHQ